MTKIIEIDICYECPECELKGEGISEKYYCFQAKQYIKMDIGNNIPEWCPLSDKREYL